MRPRLARLLPTLGLALAACGDGPGTFVGVVDGHGLAVKSAAFSVLTGTLPALPGASGGLSGKVGLVVLSSSKSVCADAEAGKLTHDSAYFALTLAKLDLAAQALVDPAAGTYAVVGDPNAASSSALAAVAAAGGVADGYFLAGGATCANALTDDQASLSGGTVTVSQFGAQAGGSARGSFSLQVGSQSSAVSGSFDAAYCAALATLASQNALMETAPPCR